MRLIAALDRKSRVKRDLTLLLFGPFPRISSQQSWIIRPFWPTSNSDHVTDGFCGLRARVCRLGFRAPEQLYTYPIKSSAIKKEHEPSMSISPLEIAIKIPKLRHWILSRSMTVFCQSVAKFGHCAAHPPERVDICIRTSNRRWNNFQGKRVL